MSFRTRYEEKSYTSDVLDAWRIKISPHFFSRPTHCSFEMTGWYAQFANRSSAIAQDDKLITT